MYWAGALLVLEPPTGEMGVLRTGVGPTTTTEVMVDGVEAGGAGGYELTTGACEDDWGTGA